MTQKLVYQIVGYDPQTEFLAYERDIPPEKWDSVKLLLTYNESDPDYVYSYPLDHALANDIMGLVGGEETRELNYFIECSDVS